MMAFNSLDAQYKNVYDSVVNAQNVKSQGAIDAARKAIGSLNGTDAAFAVGEFSKQLDGITPLDYKSLATAQIDPEIATKKTMLANTLAQTLAGYNNQKGALTNQFNNANNMANMNFDKQVENQNILTKHNMNGFSNSVLGRGLGRSTVATSGLGEMQNVNSRLVNNINLNRGNSLQSLLDAYNTNLSGVESNIANANANYNNQLSDLDLQKMNMITNLARQMENDDFSKFLAKNDLDFKNTQFLYNAGQDESKFAYSKEQDAFNNALKEAELTGMYKGQPTLAYQKYSSGGSGGYGGGGSSKSSGYSGQAGEIINAPISVDDKVYALQKTYNDAIKAGDKSGASELLKALNAVKTVQTQNKQAAITNSGKKALNQNSGYDIEVPTLTQGSQGTSILSKIGSYLSGNIESALNTYIGKLSGKIK
jgi:hypothetical protein